MNTIHVAHCSTSSMFVGTREECEAHIKSQPFDASSWHVSTVEDYGMYCYDEGYNSGHDAGYEQGSCD